MMIATREIHAALAIAAVGISGGISLSAFTTHGMWPQSSNVPAMSAFTLAEARSAAVEPPARYGPQEQYVCKGCGPTLAERRMGYYAGDYGHRSEILGDVPAADVTTPPKADKAVPYDEGTGEAARVEAPDAQPSEQAATDPAVVAYP